MEAAFEGKDAALLDLAWALNIAKGKAILQLEARLQPILQEIAEARAEAGKHIETALGQLTFPEGVTAPSSALKVKSVTKVGEETILEWEGLLADPNKDEARNDSGDRSVTGIEGA